MKQAGSRDMTSGLVSEARLAHRSGAARALKVLLVTNLYPTPTEPWYGCFVLEQAEDLAALGVDLEIIHFDGRGDCLNYLRAAREVRRRVALARFDLVHAHYGLSGAAAILQHRVPVVTTFHGSDYSGAIPWQRYLSWAVARRSFPVLVSDEGRRKLRRPSAPVIPTGVDTERFAPRDRRAARRGLGWHEDRHYVLLPGNRSVATKRADLFDAVLSEARKTEPNLTGIALAGFSREETALVLNAADAVLVTSDREGSPVTVREALACQTPVVSVDVGDLRAVLRDLPGCGIFPRSPASLARGLLDALSAQRHPDLRRRAEHYSRHATAERVAAVYSTVLTSAR
jgi:glycosyltransferase involved in cell wall biosynthesis